MYDLPPKIIKSWYLWLRRKLNFYQKIIMGVLIYGRYYTLYKKVLGVKLFMIDTVGFLRSFLRTLFLVSVKYQEPQQVLCNKNKKEFNYSKNSLN